MAIINLIGKTMGGKDKRPKVTKIARHHSATESGDVYTFERYWKGTRGWNTGGYHEIILRNGDVQLCYDYNVVSNGVYGHNQTAYHICVVGNGSFIDAQEKAFEERAKYAIKRFGLSVNDVLGHNEFSGQNTACPGINMNKVRDRLRGASASSNKQTGSTTASKLKQTGNSRIRTIQSVLNSRYGFNIPVDGYDGPITKSTLIKALQIELNKQFNAGLIVDGIWGPKTRAACITVRKGARGNITWIIQARLYCLGYNTKGIDKIFGDGMYKEVRKYQSDKQITVDGDVGKQTFTKLFA